MAKRRRFGLVLSEEEKRIIQRLAGEAGDLSQAAIIRILIRRAARDQGAELYMGKSCGVTPAVDKLQTNDAFEGGE